MERGGRGWGVGGQSQGPFRSKDKGRSSPVQLPLCKMKVLVSPSCLTLCNPMDYFMTTSKDITDRFFIGFYLLISNIFLYIFLV